jgi:hypothetical protein
MLVFPFCGDDVPEEHVQVALLVQWLGFLPSKQAARVRVPDGALFPGQAIRRIYGGPSSVILRDTLGI